MSNEIENIRTLPCPFTVAVDSRERLPYKFDRIFLDSDKRERRIDVTTSAYGLKSGDYSILGFQGLVAVERKSAEDACSTFSHGRMRFKNELERLNSMDAAWVVLEADMARFLWGDIGRSKINRRVIVRSIMSWQLRFPKVHWWFCPTRAVAEQVTFRLLEKFWNHEIRKSRVHMADSKVVQYLHGTSESYQGETST